MNLTATLPSLPPRTPPSRSTSLTEEQQACVQWAHEQALCLVNGTIASQELQNLLIEAVAGSGKTFTIIEMIVEVVLTLIEAGVSPYKVIALMSFNAKVRDELKLRITKRGLTAWVDINTVHGFGFSAFKLAYGQRKPNSYKLQDIFEPLLKSANLDWKLNKTLCTLVGLAKDTGLGVLSPNTSAEWLQLIEKHDISWDEDKCPTDRLLGLARAGFEASMNDKVKIDFSDMIFFPLLDNLPFPSYDFVFIDEAQDTNATRREVAKRMLKVSHQDSHYVSPSGRLITVGDRHQAIYGFTGADNDALDILKEEFSMLELPLSTCFRCSKAVIAHARKLVQHIHSRVGALEGEVKTQPEYNFRENLLRPPASPNSIPSLQTHAILCRKNAPLTSLAFELLRKNIPCRIEGRDIGQQLIHLCRKFKPSSKHELTHSLRKHLTEQSCKLSPWKFSILEDKISCITTVLDMPEVKSVDDFYKKIELLFSDYDPTLPPKLTLSSIHKSKGLEWPTVYLLGRNAWQPSPFATQPWMLDQETNLTYVAITRAKETLVEITVTEE